MKKRNRNRLGVAGVAALALIAATQMCNDEKPVEVEEGVKTHRGESSTKARGHDDVQGATKNNNQVDAFRRETATTLVHPLISCANKAGFQCFPGKSENGGFLTNCEQGKHKPAVEFEIDPERTEIKFRVKVPSLLVNEVGARKSNGSFDVTLNNHDFTANEWDYPADTESIPDLCAQLPELSNIGEHMCGDDITDCDTFLQEYGDLQDAAERRLEHIRPKLREDLEDLGYTVAEINNGNHFDVTVPNLDHSGEHNHLVIEPICRPFHIDDTTIGSYCEFDLRMNHLDGETTLNNITKYNPLSTEAPVSQIMEQLGVLLQ